MVDTAIDATAAWSRSGSNANAGGQFPFANHSDTVLDDTRATVARLFGADPHGVIFGANMTTLTLTFTRAVEATLRPGDRVVGTRLDHDANVSPWRIACERTDAEHVLAGFDPATGMLDPAAVVELIDERTRWVAVTAASNLIGTTVDLAPIIAAAHDAGAKVFVDAVQLAPHGTIDIATLGCDVLVNSPYKWYGPHAGVLCGDPELLDALPVAKVRPASDSGPRRWETGTPAFESIAAVNAAAEFLLEQGVAAMSAQEAEVGQLLLDGLHARDRVTVYGPPTMQGRVPTVSFNVAGHSPDAVAAHLAARHIAVWGGHSYALEVVGQLDLAESGGVVRAGVVAYITADDVERLLAAIDQLP